MISLFANPLNRFVLLLILIDSRPKAFSNLGPRIFFFTSLITVPLLLPFTYRPLVESQFPPAGINCRKGHAGNWFDLIGDL